MVNHSYTPNAHFIQDSENGDFVLMKYHDEMGSNDEITINYAPPGGAAEALMKYGFIDSNIQFNDQLTLVYLKNDEPSTDRKLSAFTRAGGDPYLKIRQNAEGEVAWEVRADG